MDVTSLINNLVIANVVTIFLFGFVFMLCGKDIIKRFKWLFMKTRGSYGLVLVLGENSQIREHFVKLSNPVMVGKEKTTYQINNKSPRYFDGNMPVFFFKEKGVEALDLRVGKTSGLDPKFLHEIILRARNYGIKNSAKHLQILIVLSMFTIFLTGLGVAFSLGLIPVG